VSEGLVTGAEEGGSELGAEEDSEGAVDVAGQGVGPLPVPGEEPHPDGDDGDEDAVGVDALTDGEGFAGGWVRWSWWPVSPRCRAIHSPWPGS